MNPRIALSASIAAILLIAGCTESTDLASRNVLGYGDSVHTNMAVQIINPEPMAGSGGNNGKRRSLMIRRYETDKVEAPVETGTTSSLD